VKELLKPPVADGVRVSKSFRGEYPLVWER